MPEDIRPCNRFGAGLRKPTHYRKGLISRDGVLLRREQSEVECRSSSGRRLGPDGAAMAQQRRAKHLVVHGVLHLLGYDHEDDDDAQAMQARERALLTAWDAAS